MPFVVKVEGEISPQASPDGMVSVSETVPVNPLKYVTVIVEAADVPTVTGVGEEAANVRLVTVNVAVVE